MKVPQNKNTNHLNPNKVPEDFNFSSPGRRDADALALITNLGSDRKDSAVELEGCEWLPCNRPLAFIHYVAGARNST